jgi:hypothetical protein
MRIALLAFSLTVALDACTPHSPQPEASASFDFLVRPPAATVDGEVWDAIAVAPEDTSRGGPATFRLYLERPGRHAPVGGVVRGVLRRGDPGGFRWFLITFGPAFEPTGGSGGMQLEVVDSLLVTVQARAQTNAPWTGIVHLPNGGQFMLALDSLGGRGAFSPIGSADNAKVLGAIAGLVMPRDGAVGVPDRSPNGR